MTTTEDIRRWATALPEVTETSHFRFHVPVFQVRGRTFAGLGKGETTAVLRVAEDRATEAATAEPDVYAAVRRQDARRSFLGLQVDLARVPADRVRELVRAAWREQAPKRLVAEHDRQ